MRRLTIIVALMYVIPFLGYSQEKMRKFDFYLSSSIGYSKVSNTETPSFNLNSEHNTLLFSYKLNKDDGICIGITLADFSGNGFNEKGSFYNEKRILSIPFMYLLSDNYGKFEWFYSIGAEAIKILDDEYFFLGETIEQPFGNSWGWGVRGDIGFLYNFYKDRLAAGVIFGGGRNFIKLDAKSNSGFKGTQKMKYNNYIGLVFNFSF